MSSVAIIGGSGFNDYDNLVITDTIVRETPYGEHSGPVLAGNLNGVPCVFLPRHAAGHRLPPHKVNYRANIWLLKQLGVTHCIACNVVGGITPRMSPDTILVPDQIIDYTYGRGHTFYDGLEDERLGENFQGVDHIDFCHPYSEELRQNIIRFFYQSGVECATDGVYGCTQGPRLETAAEIERLKRDGCDIVGMTAMPEAALAKEIGIEYASIGIVVNWAAGVTDDNPTMAAITQTIEKNMAQIKTLMPDLLHFCSTSSTLY